ncbi:SHOCT domain-containing protein [Streptomyces sp. VRA16 Mangrove soil]|uniref:SHOCT domain-containing protein n=1 Tax=Streptomyces sp. VRA16 Mangrove soil TaxID=2817434 RepID=UPI001A9F9A36|nr:SHOCT domain-containing protein [Streptomyces sp. VRA16 Mangrove soil]MBO1332742.1 SHOCT domain-containing protein [Streptomyces sp. VRA16 Mangrove soil]
MDDYPLLGIFLTTLFLFLWVMWFFLLFRIITDVFRDRDLSGWAKAGWMIFCILLPFLGVLVYVIVRGKGMSERDAAQARQAQAAFKDYVREAAAPQDRAASSVDELTRLADLHASGALTDEEFERAKSQLLA